MDDRAFRKIKFRNIKRGLAAGIGCLQFIASAVTACPVLLPEVQREKDEANRVAEQRLAAGLAKSADEVFLAVAYSVDRRNETATFTVQRTLKGRAPRASAVTIPFPFGTIVIACSGADRFESVAAVVGKRHVMYLRDGVPVRVTSEERGTDSVTFDEEVSIVLATVGMQASGAK